MIINAGGKSEVKTSGKMRTAGFTMRASAKGFRIISTTLYKDPILAIVRELIANAWDAHIANQNTKDKILVHVPNALEPWFSVKDLGIGMSDDEIFGVYTTVFDSTKDQSNDAIGAMGLGSKTPFSYNNGQSFTVTSVKDGMKAVYTAYLDQGEPAITCLIEPHATDEPNGVEVKVPVKTDDFRKFDDHVRNIVPHFANPSVETNIEVADPEFVYGDGYYTKRSGYTTSVCAVMGNVVYPISVSHINNDTYQRLSSFFARQRVYIQFDIGDLDVAASREELHYDEMTIENINERIDEILDAVKQDAQKWVDESGFETIRKAYVNTIQRYDGDLLNELTYQGKLFKDWASEQYAYKDLTGSIVMFKYASYNEEGASRVTTKNRPSDVIDIKRDYASNKLIIINDDLKTGGVGLTKAYVRETGKSVYYYHHEKPSTRGIKSLVEHRFEEGEYEIINVSSLKGVYMPYKKKKPKDSSPAPTTISTYRIHFDSDGDVTWNSVVKPTKFFKDEEYYFVSLFHDYFEKDLNEGTSAFSFDYRGVESISVLMKCHGIDEVYIVRRPVLKHSMANENATHIFDLKMNKSMIRKKLDLKNVAAQKESYQRYVGLSDAWKNRIVREHFKLSEKSDKIPMSETVISRLGKVYPNVNAVYDNIRAPMINKMLEIQENQKYELIFGMIDNYVSDDHCQKLIKLVGRKRNG